ncbi:MAG: Milk-clotting protease [Proteobacteria bacterium]|nr:Milk-clotting protease [Pseudomonadota bacterium]
MLIRPRLLLASSVLIAAAVIAPALAQTSLPVVEFTPTEMGQCADAHPSSFRGTSAVLACTCPAGASGTVWGSDTYTDDSAICAAARHKGVIGAGGGRVVLQVVPGRQSYQGSARNGVSSSNYGSWSGSFRFVKVNLSPTDVGTCDTATAWRGRAPAITCTCPANADNSRSVWGSDIYTEDSDICRAAIHAGVITNGGGRVTIELIGGLDSYQGSTRNGVASSNYGSWSGSFQFVR